MPWIKVKKQDPCRNGCGTADDPKPPAHRAGQSVGAGSKWKCPVCRRKYTLEYYVDMAGEPRWEWNS